jgi:hypothetical protein
MARLGLMARTQRTRGRSARLTSVAALALAFTGQLCSIVHMAVVEHETCAEHGELVEAAGTVAVAALEVDVDALTGANADDVHDHCPLATTPSHHEHAVSLAVEGVARALERDVALPRVGARVVDVLRVAPKTSPPVLA